MGIREKHIAPDVPDAAIIREAHCLDCPSGHREFCHSSPALISSSATKNRGVTKSIDNKSVGSVINHNQRPADLRARLSVTLNRVNLTIGIPDFGNYEAGAN